MEAFIISLIEALGIPGLVLVMALAMIIVFIPVELIVAFAGFAAAKGEMKIEEVVFATIFGAVTGMTVLYSFTAAIGKRRLDLLVQKHGRFFGVDKKRLSQTRRWLAKHYTGVVFVGQLLPGVRSAVGIVAGMERFPFGRFMLSTLLGVTVWVGAFAAIGYIFQDEYEHILSVYGDFMEVAGIVIVVALAGFFLWRYVNMRNVR